MSNRLLSFFSPFKNFDALIFFIPSGCSKFYRSASTRWTSNKSRVTINDYAKLLQIYISELNLTSSLGHFSELRLLCCSGCACVPGTAHQHFLYDPPHRPWLCFLPCHCSSFAAFPAWEEFCFHSSDLLHIGKWIWDGWCVRASTEWFVATLVAITINKDGCGKLGNFAFWCILAFDQEKYSSAIFCILMGF